MIRYRALAGSQVVGPAILSGLVPGAEWVDPTGDLPGAGLTMPAASPITEKTATVVGPSFACSDSCRIHTCGFAPSRDAQIFARLPPDGTR